MSYSSKVKAEICSRLPATNLEMMSELFAILESKKAIYDDKIEIRIENINLAKRVYALLKKVSDFKMIVKYSTCNRFSEHNIFTINVFNQRGLSDFINKLKLNFLSIFNDEEIYRGYTRGIFLSCGYIKDPKKEYSMDFFIDNHNLADDFYNILLKKKKKIFKTQKRKKILVYLRNSEDIMDILVLVGSIQHFFSYEETTMIKDLKNKTIREMNWEVANETKTLNTGRYQVKMIKYIDEKLGLSLLTQVLEEAALIRLKNPESSLQELADMLNISKSGIRNRFRRIEEIYNKLIE